MSVVHAFRHRPAARPPGRFGVLALVAGAALLFAAASPAAAAQGPVGLGTADRFAVLAYSGITNKGSTTITGDVGTFPTPSETGFGSVTLHGTDHAGDPVTQGAKDSLVTAYNDAAGRTPFTNVGVELGGSTLLAGVYRSDTFGLTGTLTLDGQGNPDAQFIFQAHGSTLITASNSRVLLINGANPCHVVWQVASSATFGTGTQFVGDVLALTSIAAQTSATFQGRLLARNGAVTLDTNTITNANCASTTATTSTTVVTTATTAGPTSTTRPVATANRTAPPPTAGTPAGTPGSTSPGAGPGSPTGPPGVATGPPTGTGTPTGTPTTPTRPPFLPFTGVPVSGATSAGVALLALGAVALAAARRDRKGAARKG